jgi:two-component system chemotaxis sensor kinase CheA
MNDQHHEAFREEAYELLAELETSLLDLEAEPDDEELIDRVFRAMHTIKGSGAMFGFEDVAAFTHEVETVFDLVRNGKLPVTGELVNVTLAARDQIKTMLDASTGGARVDENRSREIIRKLQALLPVKEPQPIQTPSLKVKETRDIRQDAAVVTYRIHFAPDSAIFMRGTNPLTLVKELRGLGQSRVVAQVENLPALEEIDPERCYVCWDIILTTDRGIDAIKDVFIFVEDECELKIEVVEGDASWTGDEGHKKLGEILVERGDMSVEEMKNVLSQQKRFGELAIASGLVNSEKVVSALAEQQHVKEIHQEKQAQENVASIRVPAGKLDMLVNLVGELVTVQARLTQTAGARNDPELASIAEEVERLTGELRDNALNIRMLPIGTTFSKFKRLVHDLSNELGKKVEMVTSGAETELDKTVIQKLSDPLVHLIRNSIGHGIEMPEQRLAAGKPAQGTIHLGAVHSGDSVLIIIRDDGAGLDKEAIRAKALEKGLIQPAVELSEKEIFAHIFAPGFSTAEKISNVSGRGVGMDVVKKAIESLRGSIEISSRQGEGTAITVKIPLTLAIIESLLVQIGSDRFLLPLSLVDECVELTISDIEKSHGRNLATVRDHMVPYIPLREKFCITGKAPDIQQIVITQVNGIRVGVVVDHVIGEHQTVIKSLGRAYKNVEGISGATILGDGAVALIMDIPQLIRQVEVQNQQ